MVKITRSNNLLYWLPVLLWMALIFALSARPAVQATTVDWADFFLKKTAHFIEYFILNFWLLLALKKTQRLSRTRLFFTAFFISVIYAASDEFHQTFIPGREGRVRDVLIDTLGISASMWYFSRPGFGWYML